MATGFQNASACVKGSGMERETQLLQASSGSQLRATAADPLCWVFNTDLRDEPESVSCPVHRCCSG